ncbi:MAPEG family protein [Marinobacter caseinilyticus]|uniref:MAPEG family protein n=1 Tax=Marinobacter caseinilyticus TaxID=2692195 RepID=UPI00140B9C63|nr:MAPEG family protein [Marinobacter caseinilyticus]
MIIPITAIYASAIGVLMLFLAFRVSTFRLKHKKGMGFDQDRDFEAAVRAHANLVENAPITLILMAIGELNGVTSQAVYTVGLALVAGRLLHAWGMTQGRGGSHKARMVGILLNWLAILSMSVLVFINAL